MNKLSKVLLPLLLSGTAATAFAGGVFVGGPNFGIGIGLPVGHPNYYHGPYCNHVVPYYAPTTVIVQHAFRNWSVVGDRITNGELETEVLGDFDTHRQAVNFAQVPRPNYVNIRVIETQ